MSCHIKMEDKCTSNKHSR